MKTYTCWLSDTCHICSQNEGPRVHVSSRGYIPTSACDLTPTHIKAPDRRTALKHYVRRSGVKRILAS